MHYNKSVGLKSIAVAAGVSVTTVSRVLRGQGEVAAETRTRIERLAAELGYRPNLAVRTMQTGRSGIIGVLLDITEDPGYRGHILVGIHDTLIPADYLPIVIWPKHGVTPFDETAQVHRLVDHRVDGIIIGSDGLSPSFCRYIDRLSIPVVIVDRAVESAHRDMIVPDNAYGATLAAEYLLGLGHRSICYFSDHGELVDDEAGRARPFMNRVNSHEEASCSFVRAQRLHGGYEEALKLLSSKERPTAIFGFNDYVAYEVYRAAVTLGLDVPSQLSIVGFGNLHGVIRLYPKLTTFEQSPEQVGRMAAERILARIAEGSTDSFETVRMKPEMVIRASAAPVDRAGTHSQGEDSESVPASGRT